MSTTSGNTTTTSPVTNYKHSTLENFKDFTRTLSAKLDNHADKLTSVVFEKKISLSVQMRLKMLFKQVTGDATKFDADAENEYLKEFNTVAYHILIAAIDDTTTRNHLEAKHPNDAHACMKYIKDHWDAKKTDDRASAKNQERNELICRGADGPQLAAMSRF